MRLTIPLAVLCLCVGACEPEEGGIADPLAPGAAGVIAIAAEVDASGYTNLEIRGFPTATDAGDDSFFRNLPTTGDMRAESLLVDDDSFPLSYQVGAKDFGATDLPLYRVVAWLARSAGTTAPAADAPWGTTVVSLDECHLNGRTFYCGLTSARADLALAP